MSADLKTAFAAWRAAPPTLAAAPSDLFAACPCDEDCCAVEAALATEPGIIIPPLTDLTWEIFDALDAKARSLLAGRPFLLMAWGIASRALAAYISLYVGPRPTVQPVV